MWTMNKLWAGVLLWGTALWTANLAWSETAKAILASLWDTVSNSTNMILDGFEVPESFSTFVAENAPLSISWWEELVWPSIFWATWAYLWNKWSKILWSMTWTEWNKVDDNMAWVSGFVGWVWFWLWSVPLASAWLSYVASRKVIEAMLPDSYAHLAKYIALAPAWFMASSSWLIDSSMAVAATALAWTWLLWYKMARS